LIEFTEKTLHYHKMSKSYVGKYYYAYYKIYGIVEFLATRTGDIRKRLLLCSSELAMLDNKYFNYLPEDLQEELSGIIKEMSKYGEYYNPSFPERRISGSFENTLSRIRNSTGEKIAKRIFYIFEELTNIPNCFEWHD